MVRHRLVDGVAAVVGLSDDFDVGTFEKTLDTATHDFVIVARPDARALAEEEGEAGIERALRDVLGDAGLTGQREDRG